MADIRDTYTLDTGAAIANLNALIAKGKEYQELVAKASKAKISLTTQGLEASADKAIKKIAALENDLRRLSTQKFSVGIRGFDDLVKGYEAVRRASAEVGKVQGDAKVLRNQVALGNLQKARLDGYIKEADLLLKIKESVYDVRGSLVQEAQLGRQQITQLQKVADSTFSEVKGRKTRLALLLQEIDAQTRLAAISKDTGRQLTPGDPFKRRVTESFITGKPVPSLADAQIQAKTEQEFFAATEKEKTRIANEEQKQRASAQREALRGQTQLLREYAAKERELLKENTFTAEQAIRDRAAAEKKALIDRQALLLQQRGLNAQVSRDLAEAVNTNKKTVEQKNLIGQFRSELESAGLVAKRWGKDTKGAIETVSLSFKSLVHIAAIRLFTTSLLHLSTAMREALTNAIEMQKRISELQTISQEADQSFKSWRDTNRELSDTFGFDIMDEIESAYQSLSNQVVNTTDELRRFSITVDEFALATVSNASNATNLLTAAINSFGLSVEDSDHIAAIFFKTVELGRVRVDELANTIGAVTVLAQDLNLKLEEYASTVAAITISGLKYNFAATQLRGVLQKLLRPTEEMSVFFKEIGVTSGEAAVQAYGLAGVLQLMAESTSGSTTELGKLFPVVRGLTGAIRLTGTQGFRAYIEALEQMEDATASYRKAIDLVTNTAGKRLEIELQRIKNIFRVDLADNLLQGVANLTNNFEDLAKTIKSVGKGLSVALGGAAVAGLVVALSNPIGQAIAALAALAAGVATIDKLVVSEEEAAEDVRDAWLKTFRDLVDANKEKVHELETDNKKYLDKVFQQIALANARTLAESNRNTGLALKTYTNLLATVETVITRTSEMTNDIFSESRDEVEKLKQDIEEIKAATEQRDFGLRAQIFQAEIFEKPAREQFVRISEEVKFLYRKAKEAAEEGNKELVQSYQQQMEDLVQQQIQIQRDANRDTNLFNDINLTRDEERISIQRRIIALKELENQLDAQLLDKKLDHVDAAQAKADQDKKAMDALEHNLDLLEEFDPEKLLDLSSMKEVVDTINEMRKAVASISKSFETAGFPDVGKIFKTTAFKSFDTVQENERIRRQADLSNKSEQQFETRKILLEEEAKSLDLVEQRMIAFAESLNKLSEQKIILKPLNFAQAIFPAAHLNRLFKEATGSADLLGLKKTLGVDLGYKIGLEFREALELAVKTATTDYVATPEEVKNIRRIFGQTLAAVDLKQAPEDLVAAIRSVYEALRFDPRVLNNAQAVADRIKAQREAVQQRERELYEQFGATAGAQINLISRETEARKANSEAIAESTRQLLISAQQLANAAAGRNKPVYQALGGPIGSDTVPAWLMPGEFVVPTSGVRGNMFTLRAMQHGAKFDNVYNDASTFTFNNTFQQATSGTHRVQARRIASDLRRQMSQGRISLSQRRPW